jgi:transposase-like protein
MIAPCPNLECPSFATKKFVKKDGHFYRRCQSRLIQRFRCNTCRRKFSHATGTLEFGQRKRRVNSKLRDQLCSGVSLRRAAKNLGLNRITVERKLDYLAKKARKSHRNFLEEMRGKVTHLQMDDLITIEHTKMKPLTVSIAVDAKRRYILGVEVASIGAFGKLAQASRKKYGRRPNHHKRALKKLFRKMSSTVAVGATIRSDEHKRYPQILAHYLPGRTHETFKGGKGCVAGQGELKKLGHDPLFIVNHTNAMMRANVNRLFRRTWCTTKRPAHLQQHLDVFMEYYNSKLLEGG